MKILKNADIIKNKNTIWGKVILYFNLSLYSPNPFQLQASLQTNAH